MICESCNFGPGYRTGEVRHYKAVDTGQTLTLCDNCAALAPEMLKGEGDDAR